MSIDVIRVSGGIFHEPEHRKSVVRFLSGRNNLRLLVVSAEPEIYRLITDSMEQVFYSGSDSRPVVSQLDAIWKEWTGSDPGAGYQQETEKLSNLLKGIFFTGDYSPALKDAVLSQGEVLSSLILAEQLRQFGIPAGILHPGELGLQSTPDYGNATFTGIMSDRMASLDTTMVWLVPGSFGISSAGRISRAGRNAADYTAAFLVSESGGDRLILWGAGRSFHAADHAIVPDAEIIHCLTYAEASELAYFDHFSLHPRTVEPLVRKHIPIHVLNPAGPDFEPETIINTENFVSPRVVKSVACTDDISVLQLKGPGVGLKPGILARITGKLAESSVNIKSVITSQVSINILLDGKSGKKAQLVAMELGFTAVNEIELLEDVSLVAIVGHGMQSNYGISATLFGAVAQNRINVILSGSGASDLVSYLLVHSSDRNKAVKAIYQAFFESLE